MRATERVHAKMKQFMASLFDLALQRMHVITCPRPHMSINHYKIIRIYMTSIICMPNCLNLACPSNTIFFSLFLLLTGDVYIEFNAGSVLIVLVCSRDLYGVDTL